MFKYFLKKKSLSNKCDDDGQPLNRNYNKARLTDRTIDELIGICKGIIFDGNVSVEEAISLSRWLEANKDYTDTWPVNILSARIETVLSDNVIDENERKELFDLLNDLTGEKPIIEKITSMSTKLPIDTVMPEITFKNRIFCFTGKFVYGTRNDCENEVFQRKGSIQKAPSLSTNYLVIGIIGSTDWIHSTHGRKIEAVVQLRDRGKPISIVSEEHWTKYL